MIKIAIVHFSVPPVIGGVETIIEAHTRCFLNNGFDVKIIAGNKDKIGDAQSIEIKELSCLGEKAEKIRDEIDRGVISDSFYTLKDKIKTKLLDTISDREIIIIHNILSVHFNFPAVAAIHEIIGRADTQVCPYKFIFWCHDITLIDPNYKTGDSKDFPWSLLVSPLNIKYIAISRLRQRELSELLHIPKKSISVIPDGIDEVSFLSLNSNIVFIVNKYNLLDADIVMLFPSRIIRRKNFELGIKVVSELKKLGKKAFFLITGPPDPHNIISVEYYKELIALVQELNVTQNIIFLYDEGIKVDDEDLKNLYSISDILLVSSKREGFGIPLLEAGIMKTPVFSLKMEPLTEVGAEDINYYISENPKDIAEAVIKFISTNKTARMFRKVLRDYTWNNIFEKKIKPLFCS